MKDLFEVGIALLIALLLVVLATGLVIASWLLFGFVVSWVWNTIIVTWFPTMPVVTTVQVAIVGFVAKVVKDTVVGVVAVK